MAQGRGWEEHETVLALEFYCRTPFGKLHERNPDIITLAAKLNRTPGALAMKCSNFASLDPAEKARGIRGLSNASEVDRAVYARYAHDVEGLYLASEQAAAKLGLPIKGDPILVDPDSHLLAMASRLMAGSSSTEVEGVRKARRLQGLFRQIVLVSYETSCAVCQLAVPELLDAAHIVPWTSGEKSRLNPANGVSMCSLHHRAFDRGLLSVDDGGRIIVARILDVSDACGLHRVGLLEVQGVQLKLPRRFQPVISAFADHRERVFRG